MLRIVYAFTLIICLWGCGNRPLAGVKKFLSAEDEAVVELMESIKKNPTDRSLLNMLPDTYQRAMDSRAAMKGYVMRDNPAGDRWVTWRRQLEASQAITDLVVAFPQASAVIKNPVQFRDEISNSRQMAASEYYQEAENLLNSRNRQDALKAIGLITKSEREVPGYRDVNNLKREAENLATQYVVVNPVDYNNYGWNYWGLQQDYLQWQMLRDLNNRSYRYTRFVSENEVRSLRVQPEKVVDMRFAQLMVSNPYTERNNLERVREIPNPARPPAGGGEVKPAFITVKANFTMIKRYINGDAILQCRIYDVATGRNILMDQFPGHYNWVLESASYSGDQRALTESDIRLLGNQFDRFPSREEVGQKLIADAYALLVRRIEQGVNFN